VYLKFFGFQRAPFELVPDPDFLFLGDAHDAALANLVMGDRVVPELLQSEVTAERLAEAVAPMLDDTPERARVLESLRDVRATLGGAGASERVAEIAAELINQNADPGKSSPRARSGETGPGA